ncbi:hypothetical protein [Hahella chejuensis]|uniref:hypothetical protein n=1 Tax=Hahella chejuensis TaxID=158327 RepID=UPI0011D14108|nr:hypothetical protein [Hahella chejuensis]
MIGKEGEERIGNQKPLSLGKKFVDLGMLANLWKDQGILKINLLYSGLMMWKLESEGAQLTGVSSKGGAYRVDRGELKASDVDFFFTSDKLQRRYARYFTDDGRLKPDKMEELDPVLQEVLDEFSETTSNQLGRKADAVLLNKSVIEREKESDYVITRKS